MAATARPVDAILTRTQQRVLALLFLEEAERTLNEIVRSSGGGSGAIRREVERMVAAGLLRERRVRNQRRFSADRASPLYPALAALAVQAVQPAPAGSPRRPRPSVALAASRAPTRRRLRGMGSATRGYSVRWPEAMTPRGAIWTSWWMRGGAPRSWTW